MRKVEHTEDMREEYHLETLGKGVRGKHYVRYSHGSNLVLLDDRVAKAFPTAESVNHALLGLLDLAQRMSPPRRSPVQKTAEAD